MALDIEAIKGRGVARNGVHAHSHRPSRITSDEVFASVKVRERCCTGLISLTYFKSGCPPGVGSIDESCGLRYLGTDWPIDFNRYWTDDTLYT